MTTKYQVLEGGKPADESYLRPSLKGLGWDISIFDTFEEALVYANKWLRGFGPQKLIINTPLDYSGYGSMIEIREVKEE